MKKRQRGQQHVQNLNLKLQKISPLTENQRVAFESDSNLVLHGLAGTGKTFISSYLAYYEIEKNYLDSLIIIRSAVPTRDIGFLPGTDKEKSAVYEEPYKDIATHLFDRGDAYEIMKQKAFSGNGFQSIFERLNRGNQRHQSGHKWPLKNAQS